MVAGDKVVCEVANLRFSGQEQLIGRRRGCEVILNLGGEAERFSPDQGGNLVDALSLWSHRVAGRGRLTEEPRRRSVQQKALMDFHFPRLKSQQCRCGRRGGGAHADSQGPEREGQKP